MILPLKKYVCYAISETSPQIWLWYLGFTSENWEPMVTHTHLSVCSPKNGNITYVENL
jgi:hypothetical protein